jgi:nucleotide-binding universal stress UspA family protein
LTVLFINDTGDERPADLSARVKAVQAKLQEAGLDPSSLNFLEETVQHSVGQGSVALGDAADSLGADLVVLSSSAVHDKHVDANLLAEFVPAPLLLLP